MKILRRVTALFLPILAVAVLSGCGKKQVAPPEPPPPPPAPVEQPAPPPPAPVEETPAPSIQDQLQDVFYDFDSSALSSAAQSTLDADGRLLNDNAGVQITIEGHCDERGTVEYNLALGDRRAQAAKDYLVRYGIADGRIQTISYGEERPFATGHDEAAWAQNRRAHFVVR
jgi:peptidoglycan-associated lipoprotein